MHVLSTFVHGRTDGGASIMQINDINLDRKGELCQRAEAKRRTAVLL